MKPADAPDVTPLTGPALLNAYLADRDVPCPRCAYNLRSLVGRRCPECGDELTLRVGLVEPRNGPYMTALAASCLGLGGSGFFAGLAATAAPSNWWTEPGARALLAMLVISAAMLAAVLLKRRSFRLASPFVQRMLAAGACVVMAALAALVIALFEN